MTADKGFYLLEAEGQRDLMCLRGYDYRNTTAHGIHLFLAAQFDNEAIYLQSKGRVQRGGDQGCVYALQRKMFRD